MTQKFILDCSVAVAWRLDDEDCDYSRSVLQSLKHAVAIVPSLWHLEMSNTFYFAKKRNRVTTIQIAAFFGMLDGLAIETREVDMTKQHMFALSQEHDLTVYDACYLNLCLTYNLPLATLDKKLAKALLDAGGKIYMDHVT
jgi:predicted nucleic acid-binding protein